MSTRKPPEQHGSKSSGVTSSNHSYEWKGAHSPHEKQPKYGSVEMRKESELSSKEKLVVDTEDVTKGKGKIVLKTPEYQPRLPYPAKVKKDQQHE